MASRESKARHPPALNPHAQEAQQDDISRRRELQLATRLRALVLQSNRERDGAVRRREAYDRQIDHTRATLGYQHGWATQTERETRLMQERAAAWERWLNRYRQLQNQREALQRDIEGLRSGRNEEKDDTESLGGGGRRRRRKSRRKKRRRRKTRRRPGKRKRRRRRTRR